MGVLVVACAGELVHVDRANNSAASTGRSAGALGAFVHSTRIRMITRHRGHEAGDALQGLVPLETLDCGQREVPVGKAARKLAETQGREARKHVIVCGLNPYLGRSPPPPPPLLIAHQRKPATSAAHLFFLRSKQFPRSTSARINTANLHVPIARQKFTATARRNILGL